jgi:hypothetical protein
MIYWIKVKRLGFALPRWYRCIGHSVTNATTRIVGANEKGEPIRQAVFEGAHRLEVHLARGGVAVYGDVTKIVYTLGKSWFNGHAKQAEQESGGVLKLAK